jgi:hypothetical protein
MVVVRADDNYFVFEVGVPARENTKNIACFDDLCP